MSDETPVNREIDKWLKDSGLIDGDGRTLPLAAEKEHRKRKERRRKMEEQYVPSDATMLDTRSAGEWIEYIRSQQNPEKLFGDFWYEGEVAILFGDTGKGKSLLAIQIADQIARGHVGTGSGSDGVLGLTATKPQKVLYFDFELNQSQFAARYSAPGKTKRSKPVRYNFPKNLIRSEIGDFSYSVPKAYEKDINGFLLHSVTSTIEDLQAKGDNHRQHNLAQQLHLQHERRAQADEKSQAPLPHRKPLHPRPRSHAQTPLRPPTHGQRPARLKDARQLRRQHLRPRPKHPRPRHPLPKTHKSPQHPNDPRRLKHHPLPNPKNEGFKLLQLPSCQNRER